MSDTTNIAWCDSTWNPWRGCTKVSPGCVNCYAELLVTNRLGGQWGKGKPRTRASDAIWHAPHKWNKKPFICDQCGGEHSSIPVKCGYYVPDYHGEKQCEGNSFHRRRVFLGSLMDIFDDEVRIEWFADAMQTVSECQAIYFLLVTKRAESWKERCALAMNLVSGTRHATTPNYDFVTWLNGWLSGNRIPQNVWMITSAETQKRLDERVPYLLSIPAPVHGLSCEPLLGPLDLHRSGAIWNDLITRIGVSAPAGFKGVDWVITGGESGASAREMKVEWMYDIQKQCQAAGVSYFAKQLGCFPVTDNANLHEWPDETLLRAYGEGAVSAMACLKDKKGGNMDEWPDELRVRQWPLTL